MKDVKVQDTEQGFLSKVRAVIWPVYGHENLKFIPMAVMMALILFNYTILRGTKDSLIIADAGGGSEVTSFLKVWGVLPFAIMFFFVYSKLSNLLSRPGLFYTVMMFFVVFFAGFTLFLYPNREALHMSAEHLAELKAAYPNFKWMFPMVAKWTDSLFYIMSELWGSVVLSLLFWQFANLTTSVQESKRFYGFFGLLGNVGVIGSGFAIKFFSSLEKNAPAGVDGFGISLDWIVVSVCVSAVLIMFLFFYVNNKVLTKPQFAVAEGQGVKKKSKPKISLGESFKMIFTSKYLGFIALLVIVYGITMNLIEQTWKDQLKQVYPTKAEYAAAMGDIFQWIGIITMSFMLIGSNILRLFGWFTSAMLTPIMMVITGGLFFGLILFPDMLMIFPEAIRPDIQTVGIATAALQFAVILGGWQNILSKSTKYSLFDPTKEMAYIPLDDDMKIKGKAAVDVVGGRLGKSGGAIMQQILLIGTAGTQLSIAPYLAAITAVGMVIWFFAVFGLNKMFVAKTQEPAPTPTGPANKDAANQSFKDVKKSGAA